MPALASVVLVTSAGAPYVWKLTSGVVWWVQFNWPDHRRIVTGTPVPLDCGMAPCIERLVCGSPSTPSSSALVATEVPAVARPAMAALVTTGLSGPPTPAGASASVIVQPAQRAAALGAQQLRVGHRQSGALQLDIQIVLDGQRQGVLKRQVEVAGADQLVDPRRILEADRPARSGSCAPGCGGAAGGTQRRNC